MVQYVTTKGPRYLRQVIDDPQDFWKIKRCNNMTRSELKDFLRKRDLPCSENALKPVLVEQHIRWQRGLLDYEKCSATEVRKFATDRRILTTAEVRKPLRKADLVAKLEEADDGETLGRFLDLPAELRVRIYEFHFHDLEEDGRELLAPFPVPITEVNSQLRLETLPVYYSTCTFDFNANFISRVFPISSIMRFRKPMQRFISEGPAQQIAMLRKLKIRGERIKLGTQYTYVRPPMCIATTVDLGTDHKLATVGPNRAGHAFGRQGDDVKLWCEESMEKLRGIIKGLDHRDGGKKLLMNDIQAICELFVDRPRYEMRGKRKNKKNKPRRRAPGGQQ